MGEVWGVSKCENCEIRKYFARAFDMHWLGEDDCPYECEVKDKKEYEQA